MLLQSCKYKIYFIYTLRRTINLYLHVQRTAHGTRFGCYERHIKILPTFIYHPHARIAFSDYQRHAIGEMQVLWRNRCFNGQVYSAHIYIDKAARNLCISVYWCNKAALTILGSCGQNSLYLWEDRVKLSNYFVCINVKVLNYFI